MVWLGIGETTKRGGADGGGKARVSRAASIGIFVEGKSRRRGGWLCPASETWWKKTNSEAGSRKRTNLEISPALLEIFLEKNAK
jgi:hypothetical protein